MIFNTILALQDPSLIIFIVDGMGPQHIEFAKIIEYGFEGETSVKNLDELRFLATQNVDLTLTDSAAAATAISTGKKTLNKYIGLDQNNNTLENLFEFVTKKYPNHIKGIVSKIHPLHATTAAFLAHSQNRDDYKQLSENFAELQLADLIISPYHEYFANITSKLQQKYRIINESQIQANISILNETDLPYIAHVSKNPQLNYFIDSKPDEIQLEQMVATALNKLKNKPFVLIIEASLVDIGSHQQNTSAVLGEMIEAELLLKNLMQYINNNQEQNIQLVMTADHETGGLTLFDELKNLDSDAPFKYNNHTQQQQKRIQRISQITKFKFATDNHSNNVIVAGGYGSFFQGSQMSNISHIADLRQLFENILTKK